MRALLIILSHQMVGEERLAATRRTEYELVAVGGYAALHWLVGNIQVDRLTREAIHHFYTEWRQAAAVVCFGSEEADGWFNESIKTFLGGEIRLVAGHRRPEQRRAVDGVVPWHTPHSRKLAADIVLYTAQFLGIVAPSHDVAVAAHRGKTVAVRLVQIAVYPLLVYGVGTAIP